MLHVATRTILGGRDPAKMKKRESSYFIFVFALMINFKFFACEPRVYYPLRNPYYIDLTFRLYLLATFWHDFRDIYLFYFFSIFCKINGRD